jgi:transposase
MDAVNLTELRKSFLPDEGFGGLSRPAQDYVHCLEAIVQRQQAHIQQQQGQIQQQQGQIQKLQAHVQRLQTRVEELEARLAKNSSNSGKPPSSDGFGRVLKSPREKSDKKPGGQKGHTGSCLAQVETPDRIVNHTPAHCLSCGLSLKGIEGRCVERRQVFEIPQPRKEVTEHCVEEKQCPFCGEITREAFPEDVRGPVQYGHRVQALETYLAVQHLIPVDRVCEIFSEVWGIPISPGACANINRRSFQTLGSFERSAKEALLASHVLHFDETGMRCEKKLHWLHVASSQRVTSYTLHAKRGREATDAMGLLPQFSGVAVHDHWQSYFSYGDALHSLCNAHHLRELTFIHEERGEVWAREMKDLLIFAKREVEDRAEHGALPKAMRSQIEAAYERILQEGFDYHSGLYPLSKNKKGRPKQREGKNLLDRLSKERVSVLRFLDDFSVPFTNNQAERDIRMVKLKQKISGCFRGKDEGQIFCRIRSYISTAHKQGWAVWDALSEAVQGNPRLVQTTGPP